MLNRKWFVATAFGLACIAAPLHAQDLPDPAVEDQPIPVPVPEQASPAGEQDARPEQQGRVPDLTPAIQGVESAIRQLLAEESRSEKQQQEERDIRDLKAQEEMALWANRMGWAAIASLVLTAAGVFLIWRTLIYTRTAAIAARDAVEEAKRTTEAAIFTMKSERAWMLLTGYQVDGAAAGAETLDVRTGLLFSPTVVNGGRSPAMHATISSDVKWVPLEDPIPRFDFGEPDSMDARSIVGPGQSVTGPAAFVPLEIFQQHDRRSTKIYIGCRVLYDDIFGDKKEAVFVDEVLYRSDVARLKGTFDPTQFEFTRAGPQNYAS